MRVSDISANVWVCLRQDYEDKAKKNRQINGRSAADPVVSFRLVVAFIRDDGNTLRVAFSDGSTVTWRPQADVAILRHPLRRPLNGRPQISATGSLLDHVLKQLSVQSRSMAHVRQLGNGASAPRGTKPGSFDLALLAAQKWGLATIKDEGSISLTDAGRIWTEATRDGFAERMSRRPRTSGRSTKVTNFFGPSNIVHGDNHGTMSAKQKVSISSEEAINALQVLLSSKSIPWQDPKFAHIHESLHEAVQEGEPSRARDGFKKLQEIAGQLVLGVGGNAAFQLLVNYFG